MILYTALVSLLMLALLYYYRSGAKALKTLRYRVSTILHAVKALWQLPPASVETFLQSYSLFDQEVVTNDTERKIIDYYSVLNWLCALGEVEKMYFPPILDAKAGTIGNQLLFEKQMAKDIGITSKSSVLDMGCGRGRIAAHVASEFGAHVTGINIDGTQIESAKKNAANNNLQDQLTFKQTSFNDRLPFSDNQFDAIYEVQAFTYIKNKDDVFREIFRVLRPGGKISMLDWFVLDDYDPKNPEHSEIMAQVKPLLGAVSNPTVQEFASYLEKAGFKVLVSHNPSIGGVQYPLVEPVDAYFQAAKKLLHILVWLGIFPKHFDVLFERLTKGANTFIKGDKLKLYTTCYQIVAQKPTNNTTISV